MTQRLGAVVVGAGVTDAHPDGSTGTVVGTFRHGCYVQVHGQVYAVAGRAVPPGPIHLVVDRPFPVAEGLAVWRDGGLLRSTDWQVDLRDAPAFVPLMPGPATLRHAAPALAAMRRVLPVPVDLRSRWDAVCDVVASGDLVLVRQLLEGRGGGLTPTGDDVLAGVLLVHAWQGDERTALLDVAETSATTNLSRSFLRWAARGQSLAPVHALVASAALEDQPGFEAAIATVSAIGGSSGTALLWGIGLAAPTTGVRGGAAAFPPVRSSS